MFVIFNTFAKRKPNKIEHNDFAQRNFLLLLLLL